MNALPTYLEVVVRWPNADTGKVFPLQVGQTLFIGRNPQPPSHPLPLPDVCLLSPSVSRRHCEVGRDLCGAWLRDLNSRNGTELNGQRLSPGVVYRLQPEDCIQIPNTVLRLRVTPTVVDPAWLRWEEGVVGRLLQRIREEEDFTILPILADALEEAGCTDQRILSHCRIEQDHAQGCWILNALLDRSGWLVGMEEPGCLE